MLLHTIALSAQVALAPISLEGQALELAFLIAEQLKEERIARNGGPGRFAAAS